MSAAEDPPFAVRARDAGGQAVLEFEGDLDVLGIAEAREAVRRAQDGASTVVLDLRGLRFMDSSGLRVVLEAHRRAAAEAGRLLIAPGDGAVRRVLDLSGVAGLVELVDEPPEAA
ncbi:MAG TPA: STAS domain-containing protein [Solirubrobacteraceae bacterium]|jgi:anti-anti-sigma factor